MEKQEIRYRVTVKAFHQAMIYALIVRNGALFRVAAFVLGGVFLYWLCASQGMFSFSFLPVYIAAAYVIYILVLLGREEQRIRRYIKSGESMVGAEYVLRFDAHTISFDVPKTKGHMSAPMKKLPSVIEMSSFYLFYVDAQSCYIVPGEALSDEQRAALRAALAEHLGERFFSRYLSKR